MSLMYKQDFEVAWRHIQAFWNHECLDRCCLQVVARNDAIPPWKDDLGLDVATRRTDIDLVLRKAEHNMRATHYCAEAMPVLIPGLCCSDMAAFFLDHIGIQEDTVWYEPVINDWGGTNLQFDPGNRWWGFVRSCSATSVP